MDKLTFSLAADTSFFKDQCAALSAAGRVALLSLIESGEASDWLILSEPTSAVDGPVDTLTFRISINFDAVVERVRLLQSAKFLQKTIDEIDTRNELLRANRRAHT